jgi:uncharacterized circularly permuted ATP-grasp superfamily protein
VRIPSGVSYVMENRRAMAQVLPEVFAATRILPVESYPGMLLRALRAAPPGRRQYPVVAHPVAVLRRLGDLPADLPWIFG